MPEKTSKGIQCTCCDGYGYHELEEGVDCGSDNEIIDETQDCDKCEGSGFIEVT